MPNLRLQGVKCADCGTRIGFDRGPPDGWQLEDGRTVCHNCCVADIKRQTKWIINEKEESKQPTPFNARGLLLPMKAVDLEKLQGHCKNKPEGLQQWAVRVLIREANREILDGK